MASAPAAASAAATLAGGLAAAAATTIGAGGENAVNEHSPYDSSLLADRPPTVVRLDAAKSFDALDEKLKHYTHHISRAAFNGVRIILRQVSPESEAIYDMILSLHHSCGGEWAKLKEQAGLTDREIQLFLEYAAQFLGNNGNYRGFGDTKIIPRLSFNRFAALAAVDPKAKRLFDSLGEKALYLDLAQPKLANFGFTSQGHLSSYYPDSIVSKEEIEKVESLAASKGLLPENNRLRKTKDGNFELLVASASFEPDTRYKDAGPEADLGPIPGLKDAKLRVLQGDHSAEMKKIAEHMNKAKEFAANENQQAMCQQYAVSFETGSLKSFKESQRHWVKDIGPTVESNIGFIETYRDPAGIRGEWEGFAAVVNPERTKTFGKLVAAAKSMVAKLPWPAEFESDVFTPPDFTSLEVLSFASSAIPAGINIPNYDDIRRNIGFKNVSLGNVLSAKGPSEPIPFIAEADLPVYEKHRDAAFEVQVGVHELLGHGSGKLLQETAPGAFNFDVKSPPISPITNKPATGYYKPDQTYTSVFGALGSSYEECRAECVAMALSCDFDVLKIFGFGDGKVDMDGPAGDVLYTSYLSMARAGLMSVKYWEPSSRKWGQIHMQARFAITQTFLRAGQDFVQLKWTKEDLSDLTILVDRSKILSVGRPAVEQVLQKIHIYKATADVKAAKELYDDLTNVDSFWGDMIRKAVIAKDVPRKVFVQGNTVEVDGKIVLKEYEASLEGMIQSFAERDV
jgi:dipeptidyl-peptidase III